LADDEELDAAALGLGEDGLRLGLAALGGGIYALGVHPRARVPRPARGAHRLHELPRRVRAAGAAEERRDRGAGAAAGPRPRGPRRAAVRVWHVHVEQQDVVALDDGVGERPLHRRRRLAAGLRDDHHQTRLGRPRASSAAPSQVDLGHMLPADVAACTQHRRPWLMWDKCCGLAHLPSLGRGWRRGLHVVLCARAKQRFREAALAGAGFTESCIGSMFSLL
jgi:hypothetical protein